MKIKYDQMVHIVDNAQFFAEQFSMARYWPVRDHCTQRGVVWNGNEWVDFEDTASMFFNYDIIPGVVLEVIEYGEPEKWLPYISHDENLSKPFIIMTTIVPNLTMFLRNNQTVFGGRLVQRYATGDHTNPNLTMHNRWFDHAVFDTVEQLGYAVKFMEKRYG